MKSQTKFIALIVFIIITATLVLLVFGAASEKESFEEFTTVALMYHAVSDDINENSSLFVSPAELEKQLATLCDMDYTSVFASEYGKYSKKTVAITFDDGYDSVYYNAFPLLKKYGIKATVFIITSAEYGHITDEQMKEMSNSGLIEFGSHTKTHSNLTSLTENQIKDELISSKNTIEALTGKKVTTLAYPYGAFDEKIIKLAKKAGYKFAYKAKDDECTYESYDIPRFTVWRETKIDIFCKMISEN